MWRGVYYGAMKLYKAPHTVFSLKYHIVCITKKRVWKFYRLVADRAKLLQQEYPYLTDEKGKVWGRGYFVTSVNDKTTSAVI